MQQHEIERSIKDNIILLSNRCTSGKVEILRALFFQTDERVLRAKTDELKQFLRKFVDDCSVQANEVADLLRQSAEVVDIGNIQCMNPDYVKQLSYVSYDYPSILQYVDGVIKGVSGGSIKSERDIEDFRNHVILQAFSTHDHNVPSLLDAVISEQIGSLRNQQATPIALALFNNMRNKNDLFITKDRNDIIACIDKVIDHIVTEDFRTSIWNDNVDKKLAILAYGSVIDYIAYIVTLYACRINIIHRFINPFIMEGNTTVTESTEVDTDSGVATINIINKMELGNMIKVANFIQTFDELKKYMKCIGVNKDFLNDYDNKLYKKLNDNIIYAEMNNFHSDESMDVAWNVIRADYTYPLKENSASKALIEMIPSFKDKGSNDCKQLAEDTYVIGRALANTFKLMLKRGEKEGSAMNGTLNGIKSFAEEMYKLCITRVHETFMEIEKHVNVMNKQFTSKSFDAATSVGVDLTSKPDKGITDKDITEAWLALTNDTAMNYQLYNEYLVSLPGFSGSVYLSEAGASGMMAKIKALFKSLGDLIVNTFLNADLKRVRKWVTDNESVLLNMDYPDTVNVAYLPYRSSLSFPEGWDKFMTAITSFNIDSAKDLEKWTKSLYPSDTMADWFSKSDPKPADLYKNHILFYPNLSECKAEAPAPIEKASASELKDKLMKQWIGTVKDSEKAGTTLSETNKKLAQAMNNIESKLVQQDNKQDAAAKAEESKTANAATTNASSTPATDTIDINSVTGAFNTVINNLWNPLLRYFYTAIKDQYKYIKEVHGIVKSHQSANDTSGTAEGDSNPLITGTE